MADDTKKSAEEPSLADSRQTSFNPEGIHDPAFKPVAEDIKQHRRRHAAVGLPVLH